MPLAQLISADRLHARLQEPGLVLLDCRFALDDPTYGARSYAAGHIPGARFADLEHDLSAPVVKGVTGRHPLPDAGTRAYPFIRGVKGTGEVVVADRPGRQAASDPREHGRLHQRHPWRQELRRRGRPRSARCGGTCRKASTLVASKGWSGSCPGDVCLPEPL